MAWFQNLAGKAEDILNKIDQNAATVLNEGSTKIQVQQEEVVIPIQSSHEEIPEHELNTNSGSSGALKLSQSHSSFGSLMDAGVVKTEIVDSPLHERLLEGVNTDVLFEEHLVKNESSVSSSSKSSSSHDSFILFEEETQNDSEIIAKLKAENHELNKQLLNIQHLYAEVRNDNMNLQNQIDAANYLMTTAQSEMEMYRARAQRVLQEKEKLIIYKQENPLLDSNSESNMLSNYNEELKKELEFQQSRNAELSERVNRLTQETAYLQQQIILAQKTSHQSSETLQQDLAAEKKMRLLIEEECKSKAQELQARMGELSQQININKMKTEEINTLKQALRQRSNTDFNEDLESRIKSLTDTLMTKQNALETVTTERNALRIQLEKLENEYHQNLSQLQRAQVRVINVNDTDDVKSQVPQFMRVSPLDAGVTRKVKHAYSTVDAISIKTGIFLRRYPLARVFVFCYIILLHLWAFVILFIYAPSTR